MGFSQEMLEAIGISKFEQALYESLLKQSPRSIEELGDLLGAEQAHVRRATKTLEDKGLVNEVAQGGSYAVVPPGMALGVLIAQRHEQLERARVVLAEWEEQYRRQTVSRNPADLVEVVTGPDNVAQRVLQFHRSAREEILILDKPPYVAPIEAHQAEIEGALDRVHKRTIYDATSMEYEDRLLYLQRSLRLGEEASVHAGLPIKLAIFDRKIGLLPVARDLSQGIEGALIVHPSSLLDALMALWNLLRAQATSLDLEGDVLSEKEGTLPLDEVDRNMITMLLAGTKIQTIARQLGLAKSTVDRRIALLVEKLGATGRFQAAYKLGFEAGRKSTDPDRPS